VTEPIAKMDGLEDAMRALAAAFPGNAKKQQQVLNGAIRFAARPTVLNQAKLLAMRGDGSGALSESLAMRQTPRRALAERGAAAGIDIVPVRHNRKAMSLYVNHYYVARGLTPPANIVASGIRHGHLVEFGSVNNSARPFLWPAAQAETPAYRARFAADLRKKIEEAVRRARRK